jgi:hypothetical protein
MIWRSAAAAATELGLLFMTDEEHAEKVVGKVCARCRCRVKCLDGAKDKQSELEQGRRATSLPLGNSGEEPARL